MHRLPQPFLFSFHRPPLPNAQLKDNNFVLGPSIYILPK